MAKKKQNKNLNLGLNAAAALFGIMVIVSMFMNYTKLTGTDIKVATGFELFKSEHAASTAFVVISLIVAAVVAGLAVLRILGLFDGKLFTLIFAAAGLALIIFSVILFIVVVNETVLNSTQKLYDRGVGVILNLVFSIIAGLCACGAFAVNRN